MKVPWSLRKDVSEETLDTIAKAVDEAEARTSGEIHVHLLHRLRPFEASRERALRTFTQLGMHRTKERNGVFVFVVMKERCFEIVADDGIGQKVDHAVWDEIAQLMSERIDDGGFAEGISIGVRKIGEVLAEHFPPGVDDTNELPDRPSMGQP